MPELGQINRREAAAFAGLAHHPRQSGSADRYRHLQGGRPEVKRILFMAALTAAKRHPTLSAVYNRLCQARKKRLVVIANATLRDIQKQANAVS